MFKMLNMIIMMMMIMMMMIMMMMMNEMIELEIKKENLALSKLII